MQRRVKILGCEFAEFFFQRRDRREVTWIKTGQSTFERLMSRQGIEEREERRFIARGELPAHRIGRQLRISEEDFLRFLDARR